jgi:elongation factor Tu
LRTAEGGRHRPFFSGYRPQFFFRTADVDGTLLLGDGSEMVMPGDTATMTVELSKAVALEEDLGFAVREGGKTVAAGTVTRLL